VGQQEGQIRNLYEIAGKKKREKKKPEKKLVNTKRKGRGRNKSKIDIEVKWGEAKKRKPTQGKKVEESCPGPGGKNIQ